MEPVNITDFCVVCVCVCVCVCVYISFPYLFSTSAARLLPPTLLQQLETCENSDKGGNNGVNKNGLDSLPCLPKAWTIALGKKRELITDKLSLPSANSPAPSLPTSVSPSFLLSFLFFDSVSFRSEDSVFVLQRGEAVCPLRIKSGLQSCDECSHECSHLTSLAHFSRSLTTSNLATAAGRVIEILYYIPHACLEETLICVMLHYITAFILLFIFPPFFFYLETVLIVECRLLLSMG